MQKHFCHKHLAKCRSVGWWEVAQDSRLTCLSMFELSIRAQTLSMWPMTLGAVWETCQWSEVISVSWTHISEWRADVSQFKSLKLFLSLFLSSSLGTWMPYCSLLTFQTFLAKFPVFNFHYFYGTSALFQQAITFHYRAVSFTAWGNQDILLDSRRLQLVSDESQHSNTRSWRVFLFCRLFFTQQESVHVTWQS